MESVSKQPDCIIVSYSDLKHGSMDIKVSPSFNKGLYNITILKDGEYFEQNNDLFLEETADKFNQMQQKYFGKIIYNVIRNQIKRLTR